MLLCRFSVRYASSATSVFKPINFKHNPRVDEIIDPRRTNRNRKYDGKHSQSFRDDREHLPSAQERDEDGTLVIRSPIDASRRPEDRGYGDDRRRRTSRDQSYEGDREDTGKHFSSRRRNNDDGNGFRNRGNQEDYRDSSKTNHGGFRDSPFAGYRPKKYDSRFSNDDFRPRNFDDRQGKREYEGNNYSNGRHVRERRETSYNNSRLRLDKSDIENKERIGRGNDEKLSRLSCDLSVDGDVENVFGIHPVLLALRAGKRTIHKIFCKQGIEKTKPKVEEIYELAADKRIEFVSVHGSEIKKIFKGDTVHQGIFCLASPLPVSVFNVDSCLDLSSVLIDALTPEESSKIKNESCSEDFQHNPPDDQFTKSSLNSNQISRNAYDVLPSTISNTLSSPREHEYDMSSAQPSSTSSLNVASTDSNQTQPISETTPSSTNCFVSPSSDAIPHSSLTDEFPTSIPSPASLSAMALSSAVGVAAMRPERDGSCGTTAPSSVAGAVGQLPEAQSKPQLWLLLDSVMDAMNVGAVLRSCCYFGVNRVLFTPSCADISPVVSKASSGAAELLPLSLMPQPGPTLAALRGRGWTVLVAVSKGAESPHKPRPLHQYAVTGNTILVVGNEGSGVSSSISEQTDAAVTIPATGPLACALGCLNVSVAAAITLHALTAQTQTEEEAALE